MLYKTSLNLDLHINSESVMDMNGKVSNIIWAQDS